MPLAGAWYALRTLKGSARKTEIHALAMFLLTCWQVASLVARGVQLQSGVSSTTTNAPAQVDLAGVWDVEMVGKGPLLPFNLVQNGVNVKMETEPFQADKHPNIAVMNNIAQATRGPVLTSTGLKASGTVNGRELNMLVNFVTGPDEIAFATATLDGQS